jgi:glyoxylase-like metal-dependent hydrolase (beta-lactamase superfamily II)
MPYDTLTLGSIEVLALLDGDRELDGPISESFPAIPAEELAAFREQSPGIYGPAGGWRIRTRAWLVSHSGGLILVDTGIGPQGAPAPEWFGAPGQLPVALAETGTAPSDIDTVVISHVHDDHIGGTVVFPVSGEPVPAFPNARYILQRADRDWQFQLAESDEEDRVIADLLLKPLEQADVVDLIDGDHRLADGIELHHAPGHTPGHQVVRLRSGSARALLSADAFNHPIQLDHPEWPSGPDASHEGAETARRALLAELGTESNTIVAPTHFAEAFGHIRSGADGSVIWRPL